MKKHLLTLVALLATTFAMAGNFVSINYSGYSGLQKLFADKNIVVHFYTDSQVFATAEHFDASSMTLIDENAFADCEVYTLLYGTDYKQEVLLSQPNYVIVKGTAQPMKNDGSVAIFNRVARLPQLTREFPEVNGENPDIRYAMDQVSQDSMRVIVEHLEAYRSRKWGSQNAFDASDWIKSRFEALGLEEVEQQAFTYSGQNAAPNVIAIQRGKVNPDLYVVCGSHFDSYSYSGDCPGADDNATGVASVLETARVLTQYDFDYSIIYCAFGCEEMGLYGSSAYASRCRQQNMDIIGYFNNDMNGYLYGNDVHIHQIYPNSAEPCGAFYRSVGAAYFPEMVIEHKNFSSGDSDHTSFNNNGYLGIYPFEDVDHYSPYIHSPDDVIGLSVNGWLMPQRYCQMNLGCLAECAVIHPRGPVVFNEYVLHDEGNYDGKMNPGERIVLDVTMQNAFDYAVNGVNVSISCDDENLLWFAQEADFGNFAAGETKTVEHAFEFFLNEDAPAPAAYRFMIVADNGTESCTSSFKITAYAPTIEYANVVVLDENGMLEPGETADLRFLIDNVGNEIAFDLDATLASDFELITINSTEAHVADAILPGGMAYVDFNVTLSSEATADMAIPFTLTVGGKVFEVVYKNACNVIFTLSDSYGDGWNGASLLVSFSDGTPQQTMSVSSGSSAVYTVEIGTGVEVTLTWRSGSWDNECSFTVAYEGGETIYVSSNLSSGTLFTWTNDCAAGGGEIPEFCGSVRNLRAPVDTLHLYWDAPEGETPESYDVYRETVFVANTTETEFLDDPESFIWPGNLINYCVLPVYGNCQGEMACVEAYWDPDGVAEEMDQVSIYPNPAEHQVKIDAVGMQRVEVFNVLGQQVEAVELGGQNNCMLNVEGLNSGLYLVRIVTNAGVETVSVVVK